jgi:hypothetical protein
MIKSGLMMAAVAIVLGAIGGVICCCCGQAAAILMGAAAGILAVVFEHPATVEVATRRGAVAGAMAGVGALLGQLAAAGINFAITQQNPQGVIAILGLIGIKGVDANAISNGGMASVFGGFLGGVCMGSMNLAIAALLGALGALVWQKMTTQKDLPSNEQ